MTPSSTSYHRKTFMKKLIKLNVPFSVVKYRETFIADKGISDFMYVVIFLIDDMPKNCGFIYKKMQDSGKYSKVGCYEMSSYVIKAFKEVQEKYFNEVSIEGGTAYEFKGHKSLRGVLSEIKLLETITHKSGDAYEIRRDANRKYLYHIDGEEEELLLASKNISSLRNKALTHSFRNNPKRALRIY